MKDNNDRIVLNVIVFALTCIALLALNNIIYHFFMSHRDYWPFTISNGIAALFGYLFLPRLTKKSK